MASETEVVEQEDPAGDDDPAADRSEDEDRTSAEEVHGFAGRCALVFIHAVRPERLMDEDGEVRLPSADLAETFQDLGGVAEPSSGADPASCETDLC